MSAHRAVLPSAALLVLSYITESACAWTNRESKKGATGSSLLRGGENSHLIRAGVPAALSRGRPTAPLATRPPSRADGVRLPVPTVGDRRGSLRPLRMPHHRAG